LELTQTRNMWFAKSMLLMKSFSCQTIQHSDMAVTDGHISEYSQVMQLTF